MDRYDKQREEAKRNMKLNLARIDAYCEKNIVSQELEQKLVNLVDATYMIEVQSIRRSELRTELKKIVPNIDEIINK